MTENITRPGSADPHPDPDPDRDPAADGGPAPDQGRESGRGGAGGDGARAGAGPWYRRRGVLVAVGVVVVLAVTVITDLPAPTSRSSDIADATSVIRQVDGDIAPCEYSVREAFLIYGEQTAGTLTSADRGAVPGLLRDDQTACSFTNASIYDLSDVEVTGSGPGKHLADMVNAVTLWTTGDALGAIEAIQTLSTDPSDGLARAALARYGRLLASDRAEALSSLHDADAMLHTSLPGLGLPRLATG